MLSFILGYSGEQKLANVFSYCLGYFSLMSVKFKFLYENKNVGFDKMRDRIIQHVTGNLNNVSVNFLRIY